MDHACLVMRTQFLSSSAAMSSSTKSEPAASPAEASSTTAVKRENGPVKKESIDESESKSASSNAVDLPQLPELSCAICSEEDRGDFVAHPTLGLAICKSCASRIEGVKWTTDEEGFADWCSLCADGGELMLCEDCKRAICHEDCEDLVGEDYLEACQKADVWRCWYCDNTPIAHLQADTRAYLAIPHALRRLSARAAKEKKKDERRRKQREKQQRLGKKEAQTAAGKKIGRPKKSAAAEERFKERDAQT